MIDAEFMKKRFLHRVQKRAAYLLRKKNIVKTIRDKVYTFGITVAVCVECGEEMFIPGLIDKNAQEIDEQYSIEQWKVLCRSKILNDS